MAEQNYANGYFDFNDWQNYGITRSDIEIFYSISKKKSTSKTSLTQIMMIGMTTPS